MADLKLRQFREENAIETASFGLILSSRISEEEAQRLDELVTQSNALFPKIESVQGLNVTLGADGALVSSNNKNRDLPERVLSRFGSDGSLEWNCHFGENKIKLSCYCYGRWDDTWPEVQKRLEFLMGVLDPQKKISSIDYAVVDTFYTDAGRDGALAGDLFAESEYIPSFLLKAKDQKWMFAAGWFDTYGDIEQLVRLDSATNQENGNIRIQIQNSLSNRLVEHLEVSHEDTIATIVDVFFRSRQKNKKILSTLLVANVLGMMGIESA